MKLAIGAVILGALLTAVVSARRTRVRRAPTSPAHRRRRAGGVWTESDALIAIVEDAEGAAGFEPRNGRSWSTGRFRTIEGDRGRA